MAAPSAGPDQTVGPFAEVTLTASDPEAGVLTWTQTAGTPSVALGGSGAVRTFTAPATREGTLLTFRATDAEALTDEIIVSVLPQSEWAVIGGVEVPMRILSPYGANQSDPFTDVFTDSFFVSSGGGGGFGATPFGTGAFGS